MNCENISQSNYMNKDNCVMIINLFDLFSELELAVFRDTHGHVHALDAFCPHLGANLAVGGKVRGSCLECPFHAWKWNGEDGKCVDIPGAKKSKPQFISSWKVP